MVGIDVVDVDRFRTALARSPGLVERLFLPEEIEYGRAHRDPAVTFAGTFAAKEAVIKACALGPMVAWARRIAIHRAPSGAPRASVGGRTVAVSISHDGGVAVAAAVASEVVV